jgi:hypothetical protein
VAYVLPEGFPNRLSDEELDTAVAELTAAATKITRTRVLPELQLALVTAALSEQSRRELASSSRIARVSLAVAALALAVAVIALFLA